jgi:Ser/Thr protein kinase RdoA (MazF antagonist)
MVTHGPTADTDVLTAMRRRLGLNTANARLLSAHSNAVYHLPEHDIVVRLAAPETAERIAASISVTRHLAAAGFPTVEPADISEHPVLIGGLAASFWRYVPAVRESRPTSAELGRLLRDLHARPSPPVALPRMTDPMTLLPITLAATPNVLPAEDRAWLLQRHAELLAAWRRLCEHGESGLIHGDAHLNNLIRHSDGRVLLADWDNVSIGPRSWDLIQPYYTHRRLGLTDEALDAFIAVIGTDLRQQQPASVNTLIAIRELSGLPAYIKNAPTNPVAQAEVRWRVRTLRDDDTSAQWTSPHNSPGASV